MLLRLVKFENAITVFNKFYQQNQMSINNLSSILPQSYLFSLMGDFDDGEKVIDDISKLKSSSRYNQWLELIKILVRNFNILYEYLETNTKNLNEKFLTPVSSSISILRFFINQLNKKELDRLMSFENNFSTLEEYYYHYINLNDFSNANQILKT